MAIDIREGMPRCSVQRLLAAKAVPPSVISILLNMPFILQTCLFPTGVVRGGDPAVSTARPGRRSPVVPLQLLHIHARAKGVLPRRADVLAGCATSSGLLSDTCYLRDKLTAYG